MEVTVQEEISQIKMGRPHVVMLGAGASYAAFPNGDKYGKKLPLMNNFIQVLGLEKLLAEALTEFKTNNFEEIYDQLHKNSKYDTVRAELEKLIYAYFRGMDISDQPTIYDHLLLSLRGKDVVATFNWDPFLIQAYRRNGSTFSLPRLIFLHGNVMVGVCEKCKVTGVNGNICSKCRTPLQPTKLLYPIGQKNYHLDGFISNQWKELQYFLKEAFMITVFGYGAPVSDVSAVELMKEAWGDVEEREMEQTEIIDVRDEADLQVTWDKFIHTHHYKVHSNFYDSWIANHPRRTGEAYISQYWEAQFINNNPLPKDLSFPRLWEWLSPLKEVEEKAILQNA